MDIEALKAKHVEEFGEEPEIIVYSPGRVNLIGEHTDYSEGFVMPIAIGMGIWVAISKNTESDNLISVYSIDYNKKFAAYYNDPIPDEYDWFKYPIGVVLIMKNHDFKVGGLRITFGGNVPQGAGLSSSAALEVATAYAIQTMYSYDIPGPKLAKICQQAEHEVIGVKCGIMDQYISRMGEEGKAMLIDCRSLEYRLVPLELGKYKIIITNSNVPHKLSSSDYNTRVAECEEAVKVMNETSDIKYLRDFTIKNFQDSKMFFSKDVAKRAFHVIKENERVLQAEIALKEGKLEKFGELMNDSHDSLRDNYEVSSPELDFLVETARSIPGCLGSRMTGAGFGGCTVSIMDEGSIEAYKQKLVQYQGKFGYKPQVYESTSKQGAKILWKKN
jgi:galactokinase